MAWLRVARAEDAAAVQAIVAQELFLPDVPDFHWHLPEHVSARIADGGTHVAELEGRIVGILDLEVAEGELWIAMLAVVPSARRRGIARQLVALASRIARARGFARLVVSTFHPYDAVAAYERLGFRVMARDHEVTWLESP